MIRYFSTLLMGWLIVPTTNAQVVTPAAYSSGVKINYIRTFDALAPITNEDTLISKPNGIVRQTTQYFDGLGRLVQTVKKKQSLISGDTAKDFIETKIYDEFGREQYQYLPFAANGTGGNTSISDGKFKLNPFQQDSTFCKTFFSDESYYYRQNVYEASPLNRILENYEPGNNWVGTANQSLEINRHGNKSKNWTNTNLDSVRIWNITNVSNDFGTYSTSDTYGNGELYKTVHQSEDNRQVIEFKDKNERLILKKIQFSASADSGAGSGYYGWQCTYYLYDDLGNLRCIVQPKGVELLVANGWDITFSSGVILKEQCFRFEYDAKSQTIMKRLPGSGTEFIIYDSKGRRVMNQDSSLRAAHKWLYTLYDALNRDTLTGLITDDTYYNNAPYHRTQAASNSEYPDPSGYTNEVLTKKFYDSYNWRAWEGNPLSATRNSSYDSYLLTSMNAWPYPDDPTLQNGLIKGMLTGMKIKILGTSNSFLYSTFFYDNKARLIQTQSTNITGGVDIGISQYSWSDQPVLRLTKHEKAGTNSQTSIILTRISYDDLWRVTKTEQKISTTKVNSGAMPTDWTVVSSRRYGAFGETKKKIIGSIPLESLPTDNPTGLDSLDYDYNIRGWLLGMNRAFVKDTTSQDNWFGYDLGFDKTSFTVNGTSQSYATAQYNGNIAGMMWRSSGDDMLRKYDFTYDAVNRVTTADFNQLNSNSFSKAAGIDFSVNGLTYDANGNIGSMNQKGWKLGGSVTIDSLVYGYVSNSNRLDFVNDRANDTLTKLGDFKQYATNTSTDYAYDGNANLILDSNRRISSIHYNHLNLPDSITVMGKGVIKYVYDAVGNKIKKIVTEGARTTTTLYLLGNYINDTLQFIPTDEGRARINNDSNLIVRDYMIKDQLGNVRMILTDEKDTTFYIPATMEEASIANESLYYANLNETVVTLPSNYPPDDFSDPNKYGAKLVAGNGNVAVIGPSIALKVMAGDEVAIRVSSWWEGHDPGTPINPLPELLASLTSTIGGLSGSHATAAELTTSNVLSPGAVSFLDGQTYDDSKPKAYINWILFDERFNYVSNSSGYEQVGDGSDFTIHTPDVDVAKNGYLFVYVSNASEDFDVYFDNLQVTHIRGPLVEETHYYPFGLAMAGISSNSLNFGGKQNKIKFNSVELANKEFANGAGLELFETTFRSYDAQIGRFHQIDPLTIITHNWSPYNFCLNNPLLYSDRAGLDTIINGINLTTSEYNSMVTVTAVKKPPLVRYDSYGPRPIVRGVAASTKSSGSSQAALYGTLAVNPEVAAVAAVVAATVLLSAAIIVNIINHSSSGIGSIPFPGTSARDNTTIAPPVPIAIPIDIPIDIPTSKPKNSTPTKVYEIRGWDIVKMKFETLKYGVASTEYDTYGGSGNRRPDGQLGGKEGERLRDQYPNLIIGQITLATLPSKELAHIFENNLVVQYIAVHGEPPPEQGLPSGRFYR